MVLKNYQKQHLYLFIHCSWQHLLKSCHHMQQALCRTSHPSWPILKTLEFCSFFLQHAPSHQRCLYCPVSTFMLMDLRLSFQEPHLPLCSFQVTVMPRSRYLNFRNVILFIGKFLLCSGLVDVHILCF